MAWKSCYAIDIAYLVENQHFGLYSLPIIAIAALLDGFHHVIALNADLDHVKCIFDVYFECIVRDSCANCLFFCLYLRFARDIGIPLKTNNNMLAYRYFDANVATI